LERQLHAIDQHCQALGLCAQARSFVRSNNAVAKQLRDPVGYAVSV
jgi:hypothetical protein